MAGPYYVRSSDGDDADSGLSWALAKATLGAAVSLAAANETIYVDDDHQETLSTDTIYTFAGTAGNPVRVIVVLTDTTTAVAGYATGATITGAPSYSIRFDGEVYIWGMELIEGKEALIKSDDFSITFEECKILIEGNGRFYGINNILINTDIEFYNSSAYLRLGYQRNSGFIWRGGKSIGDPTLMLDLFYAEYPYVEITGVDLSSIVGGSLIDIGTAGKNVHCVLKGIKLNATPPNLLTSFYPGVAGASVSMDIADSGNTVYKFRREFQYGYAQDETVKVITGKALYDGTNEFTAKMVSRATPTPNFYDPWRYHLTTLRETGFSASRTYTVHIAQDHADTQPDALNNDEVWLEVVYPDDSTAQFNIKTDKIATPTTTPAAQTASTETWEGLAATTRLQKLEVQIDAADGKNGPVEIWACLAKESKTVYVCPEVYVS